MTRPDLPITHGYTLDDVHHLTRTAIQRRSAYSVIDADERYAAGWHAAVELLLTAEEPPTRHDIIRAAWDAADALGLDYQAFCRRISTGRARYLALWLEGETPRRGWRDRRRTTPETQLHSVSAHIRKRRRATRRSAA